MSSIGKLSGGINDPNSVNGKNRTENTNETGKKTAGGDGSIISKFSIDYEIDNKTGDQVLSDADDAYLKAQENYKTGKNGSLTEEQKADIQKNPANIRKLSPELRREALELEADRAGIKGENREAYIKMRTKSMNLLDKIAQKNADREPNSAKNKLLNQLAQDVANGEKVFFYRDENGKLGPNPKFQDLDAEELNEVLTRAKNLEANKTASSDTTSTKTDKTNGSEVLNQMEIEKEILTAKKEILQEKSRLNSEKSSSSDTSIDEQIASKKAELEKLEAEIEKMERDANKLKTKKSSRYSGSSRYSYDNYRYDDSSSYRYSSSSRSYRHRNTSDYEYYRRTFGWHGSDGSTYRYNGTSRSNTVQKYMNFADNVTDVADTTVGLVNVIQSFGRWLGF